MESLVKYVLEISAICSCQFLRNFLHRQYISHTCKSPFTLENTKSKSLQIFPNTPCTCTFSTLTTQTSIFDEQCDPEESIEQAQNIWVINSIYCQLSTLDLQSPDSLLELLPFCLLLFHLLSFRLLITAQ